MYTLVARAFQMKKIECNRTDICTSNLLQVRVKNSVDICCARLDEIHFKLQCKYICHMIIIAFHLIRSSVGTRHLPIQEHCRNVFFRFTFYCCCRFLSLSFSMSPSMDDLIQSTVSILEICTQFLNTLYIFFISIFSPLLHALFF